jgi:hypothetical protein
MARTAMNKIRILSAFTVGTIYEKVMQDLLLPTILQYGIPYYIVPAKDHGEWAVNSRQRPLYIREAMEKFPGENFVWIDADAKILKYPELLFHIPENCDVGVHYMDWADHYGRSNDKGKIEILDGTSYYKNSDKMKKFCDEWIERSVTAGKNHRHVLGTMIDERMDEDLNLFILPRDYCYVLNRPDGSQPAVPLTDPVIAHFQASRLGRHDLYGKQG